MVLDVWKQIAKKQFASLYVIYGPESFISQETIVKLKEHALNGEELEFNVSSFDMEETPVQLAVEEAETFPFMGERKLILIHNPLFLTAEKGKEKVSHNLQALLDYVDNPSPFSIMVIAAPYEKLDERKKITKELKRKATVIEANRLKEQELHAWAVQQANSFGVDIEDEAVRSLIEISGHNLLLLSNELQKMAFYAKDEGVITVQTVEALASKSLEQTVLTLVDYIMNRRVGQAIELLQALLRQKEEPIKILALMASQIRIMYVSKEMAGKGYGQQKIASYLKVHPFRVKLAIDKARGFSQIELMRVLNTIADADYKMKTGQMDKALLLELIILQIGGQTRQR
ncbi:DNA polymerase III subunit delta [Bacillus testis]|uniref:DNA polymerase III subunit delta n=1 Tax=Bacillus testis TaxID=1622072 RepID=UPI00067E81A9|nr:DNA polymerase III subunit delta [Bacillus testis]